MNFDQTIGKSFNIDFCQRLEYQLSQTFRSAGTGLLKHFWCDGVDVPENSSQISGDFRESRQIVTVARLGETGRGKYQMIIKLGEKSFERCIKGLNLKQCLPSDQSLDWVSIDPIDKAITLQLL